MQRTEEGGFATSRSVNINTVKRLIKKYSSAEIGDGPPSDWGMIITSDFIETDSFAKREILEFIADYAEQEEATIFDSGIMLFLTPDELRERAKKMKIIILYSTPHRRVIQRRWCT